MPYITPAQLARGPEALKELSELLGVDPTLLQLTLDGGDRTDYSDVEIAGADAALATLTDYIGRGDAEIDARLAQRGYALPLSAASFPILTVWAAAIVRYHLARMRDRTTEETGRVERDYREALRALALVADGKLSLGANDPLTVAQQTDGIQISSNPRIFTRSTLGRL